MNEQYNRRLSPAARELRRNMTKEERRLWYLFLRGRAEQFYRQKVIGPYIVDFYCPQAKLVIEVDGGQHYEPTGQSADRVRDAYLNGLGIVVARYSNRDVNCRFDAVCADILRRLNERAESRSDRLHR